jgi:multimeric flavodoxin WrbA
MPAVKARMLEADGLILASPVYVNDVSGTVKNWMDRLAHASHRPAFAGKCAYLLATVGDGPSGHALRTMHMALSQWGFYIAGQSGFKTGALMAQDELEANYQEQTSRIAGRLFRAIHEQRFRKPSFVSLMTFCIQQRYWQRNGREEKSLDYAYWQSRGWTEPKREFYIDHEAGWFKVRLARLAGAALARAVT